MLGIPELMIGIVSDIKKLEFHGGWGGVTNHNEKVDLNILIIQPRTKTHSCSPTHHHSSMS